MLYYGIFLVDEEISPLEMQTTKVTPKSFIITISPTHPTMDPGDCVVEEEIPLAG
jgi:hypothetical protein